MLSFGGQLKHFLQLYFCTYEPINPYDPFGKVMVQNIEKRGFPLMGIEAYPSLSTQKQRYLDLGFPNAQATTMFQLYNTILDKKDISRIEHLEIFDEFEEWKLIQEHYCFVLALKEENELFGKIFKKTKMI